VCTQFFSLPPETMVPSPTFNRLSQHHHHKVNNQGLKKLIGGKIDWTGLIKNQKIGQNLIFQFV
jgi:hypothetical protein